VNYLLQGAERRQEARFNAVTLPVTDDNTGDDERSVEVAQTAFQIRLEGEQLERYSTLQIASIVRSPNGVLTVDERFIPPSLSLAASERLKVIARRILEMLVARSLALAERHTAASMQRELSPADFLALGLLATVNGHIPLVNHHLSQERSRPEALYRTLLGLAGTLTAQIPGSTAHPRSFPVYEHGNLTACFNEIDDLLRGMLGEATPRSNYVRVNLQPIRENLYGGQIEQSDLDHAQFFLVARGNDMAEDRLVSDLPRMLRIASPATIEDVLRSYTRALGVEHTHRLPVGLPVDQRANYFQVQNRGPFWDAVRGERAIAVFIPAEFSGVRIEIVAVQ
jgi:type VI secretion system protein ImpJ